MGPRHGAFVISVFHSCQPGEGWSTAAEEVAPLIYSWEGRGTK